MFTPDQGEALLQAFALSQLHQLADDMIFPDNGGTVVGRALDANATAKDVIDSLAIVNAVRFNVNATATPNDVQALFSSIVTARKAELLKENEENKNKHGWLIMQINHFYETLQTIKTLLATSLLLLL